MVRVFAVQLSVQAPGIVSVPQPLAVSHLDWQQPVPSGQLTGRPEPQDPPPHVSPVVQALPSSHALLVRQAQDPPAFVQ